MADKKWLVLFVHGWSVTHTDTYGKLPERLVSEAAGVGLNIGVREIFLGKYISFHDEVRLEDLSRGFDSAVEREVAPLLGGEAYQDRFACITHSTGGPVVRDWWQRFYVEQRGLRKCPLSHLVMLAPANFGSALAQLGKARVARLKAWFEGVEPGSGVLDWLELGSPDSWALNSKWIFTSERSVGVRGLFPFVITGQSIDRRLYDNLNNYTGESGSDGVVRVAATNLNSTHVKLLQQTPKRVARGSRKFSAPTLDLDKTVTSPRTAMRVVAGKSHSGNRQGIMRSIVRAKGEAKDDETVQTILSCLKVRSKADYTRLCDKFDAATERVQKDEQLEIIPPRGIFGRVRHFFHDRYSMVIFRLQDHQGYTLEDFDLILTAAREGETPSPNRLPKQFLADRQRNTHNRGFMTFFFNYHAMTGCDAISNYREAWTGTEMLGFEINPRPHEGFVHYFPCGLAASAEVLQTMLKPNQTTLVEIRLHRVVYEEVFQLERGIQRGGFKGTRPSRPLGPG